MNRNLVFIIFALVVGIGIVGMTLIILIRPDATATMLNSLVILLGLLSGFAVTAHGLTQLTKKVEQVEKQTNGTLSKKDEEISALTHEIRTLERGNK